jgi:hypothetical protein
MTAVEEVDPVERSRRLRQEADLVLEETRAFDILRAYGRIVPTGSYYLDVMVYPDVDLYISKVSIEQLFDIGAQFASSPLVFQVVFEKAREVRMAGGLYLKPRIEYGDWGRPWKVDIWSLDERTLDEVIQPMYHFKQAMTPYLREQIIRYKASILTTALRTPMYSGYLIYRAFIDEGMSDPEQVTRYLIEHGIQIG